MASLQKSFVNIPHDRRLKIRSYARGVIRRCKVGYEELLLPVRASIRMGSPRMG